jgi:hypothetical protein
MLTVQGKSVATGTGQSVTDAAAAPTAVKLSSTLELQP